MSLDPISAAFNIGGKLIDRLWPDPEEKDKAKLALAKLMQDGELAELTRDTELAKAQARINEIDAASDDKFKSRARPFILWVCGVAFAYHFILQPIIVFYMISQGMEVKLPEFDMNALNTVLMGLLGLGGMRTFEKVKRVTK